MNLNRFDIVKNRLLEWLIRRPSNVVGIDIGTGHVKAAEVLLNNGQPVLKAVGLIDLPENVMQDGYVANAEALADIIRRLLSTSGISSREVVVAVSGRSVFVREVMLPAMSKEELKEAIKWDLEKYVPYEPDSYYYDFAVIGQGKSELEIRVLLVAAPHDLVNTLIAVLKEANCKPLAIDIEPLALYRTLADAKNAIVIDIGNDASQVIVFQGSSPSVTRFIPVGGLRFTEVIMQTLELDYMEAERLKQRQAGLLKRPDFEGELPILHQRLELLVAELAREVRRTFEYYQVQNREAVIDRIYLTGGGAKLDNLPQHLTALLGDVQVLQHNPLNSLTAISSFDEQYLRSISTQMAVAIGLAMRGGNYDNN
ncbi:type IV pilus assembly protein PilM [Sporomusa sp.]|uniref:type IV pilus assembly protein PilM n=1 Tax=Sporomusa sp. TaxID=2078658 RepID=UPI002D0BEAF4|nr:type IV pilus assembly protein PilM [Sporomusa sp.]HWR43645.1 type IV pilus assembly protein PilM [Sporomusa sp.]